MHLASLIVLAAAVVAAVAGLRLRRHRRDPLPAKLVAAVLAVAGVAVALTGAIGPAVVLLATSGAMGAQALCAR
jgi:hypothetical protein